MTRHVLTLGLVAANRQLTLPVLLRAFEGTVRTTCMVMLIVIAAFFLNFVMVSIGLALGTTEEMIMQYGDWQERGLRAMSPLAIQMYMPNAPAAAVRSCRITRDTAWSTSSVRPSRGAPRRSFCRHSPDAWQLAEPPRRPRRTCAWRRARS